MNGYTALLGLLGLGCAAGILVLAQAARTTLDEGEEGVRRRRVRPRREHAGRWLVAAGTAGLLAGAVTGWVAGGLLAAMATWALPQLLGSGGAEGVTARVEGIAGWTEMLRDTLAAAAGLEQTITATAPTAPAAVRPHIKELAARLEAGERLPSALRKLADDLQDPTADLVIAALMLASVHQAREISSLLGELAATARAQVEMHQRVAAGRARTRTTLRVVVTTSVSFAGGLVLFNPMFLAPYDTVTGQLVLLVVGALFTAAFVWLRRMARTEEPERFFTGIDAFGPAASTAGTEQGAT